MRTASVEAVFEDVEVKNRLWAAFDAIAPRVRGVRDPHTSSISIDRSPGPYSSGRAGGSWGCTSSAPCR